MGNHTKSIVIGKAGLLEAWKKEICDHSEEVDPEQEFTWEALFIGFAVGKGFSIKDGFEFYDNAYEFEKGTNSE